MDPRAREEAVAARDSDDANQDPRNTAKLAMDTRAPETTLETKTWNFVVEVSDPGKAVTLSVPNADVLPGNYKFRIRDNVTGSEFDPKQQKQYVFNETGTTRSFSLSSEKLSDAAASSVSMRIPRGWSLLSVRVVRDPCSLDVKTMNRPSGVISGP